MDYPIILFDGVCNLCSASVQWVIRHDAGEKFKFAAIQSRAGSELFKQYDIPPNSDSIVLIENGRYYLQSAAALRIARKCRGLWPLLYGFIIVPRFIRDTVYNLVARKRYRWFGKLEECWLPAPELKSRFL